MAGVAADFRERITDPTDEVMGSIVELEKSGKIRLLAHEPKKHGFAISSKLNALLWQQSRIMLLSN